VSPLSTVSSFTITLLDPLDSCPVELKARCFGGSLLRRKLKVVSSFPVMLWRAGGYGGTVSQPLLPVSLWGVPSPRLPDRGRRH